MPSALKIYFGGAGSRGAFENPMMASKYRGKSLLFLFKRYMQTSTDHARKYGGTGLGLAICKQLYIKVHGELTAGRLL